MAIILKGKNLVEAQLNGKKLAEAWINGHRVFPNTLTVEPERLEFIADGEIKAFSINSNESWTITQGYN